MRLPFFLFLTSVVLLGFGCSNGSSSQTDAGVFVSANGGEDFEPSTLVLTSQGLGTLASTEVSILEMDPEDHLVLYTGTSKRGLLFTEDGGQSWMRPRVEALKDGYIRDVEVDPTDVCTVYVAKDQRLYKTVDCGRNFDSEVYVETRTDVSVHRIAVDWYNAQIVWIGLTNGDVLKSEDAGATWRTTTSSDSAITDILVSNADSRNVLVSTSKDGFLKTSDSGATWNVIEESLDDYKKADQVLGMAQTQNTSVIIASTTYGLLRSFDGGETWEPVSLITASGEVSIRAFGIAPDDANKLYYASGSTFYRSEDGGTTWTTSKIQTTKTPNTLVIDPTETSRVYVGIIQLDD